MPDDLREEAVGDVEADGGGAAAGGGQHRV